MADHGSGPPIDPRRTRRARDKLSPELRRQSLLPSLEYSAVAQDWKSREPDAYHAFESDWISQHSAVIKGAPPGPQPEMEKANTAMFMDFVAKSGYQRQEMALPLIGTERQEFRDKAERAFIVPEHAEQIAMMAGRRREQVAFRETTKTTMGNLKRGFAAKGLHIKPKSYVPDGLLHADQTFAKPDVNASLEQRNKKVVTGANAGWFEIGSPTDEAAINPEELDRMSPTARKAFVLRDTITHQPITGDYDGLSIGMKGDPDAVIRKRFNTSLQPEGMRPDDEQAHDHFGTTTRVEQGAILDYSTAIASTGYRGGLLVKHGFEARNRGANAQDVQNAFTTGPSGQRAAYIPRSVGDVHLRDAIQGHLDDGYKPTTHPKYLHQPPPSEKKVGGWGDPTSRQKQLLVQGEVLKKAESFGGKAVHSALAENRHQLAQQARTPPLQGKLDPIGSAAMSPVTSHALSSDLKPTGQKVRSKPFAGF